MNFIIILRFIFDDDDRSWRQPASSFGGGVWWATLGGFCTFPGDRTL